MKSIPLPPVWERRGEGIWGALLAALTLVSCGGSSGQPAVAPLQVFATSATATPAPTATIVPLATAPVASATVPVPTPTAAPITYTLDFTTERRDDVTLHVGQALQLALSAGPSGDWLSGVDDARVLRPMSPSGSGVYQAMAPGTALLTAHVLQGCANVAPARPCSNPEHGLWFQTRVWVLA